MSRSIITKTYYSFDELGNPVYDKSHSFDSVQAVNSTPQDQEAPCVIVSVGAADGTSTWAGLATYTITYHVQYFELQWADFSTGSARSRMIKYKEDMDERPRVLDDRSESSFENEKWVEPTPKQKDKLKKAIAKGSSKVSEAR